MSHLDLAARFVAAIERGDIETVRACYAPDARIWHNTDNIAQTVDENLKVLRWMVRTLADRRYDIVARSATADGFVQQHVLRATINGAPFAMPACIVCIVREDRITRLDEYLDGVQVAALTKMTANQA